MKKLLTSLLCLSLFTISNILCAQTRIEIPLSSIEIIAFWSDTYGSSATASGNVATVQLVANKNYTPAPFAGFLVRPSSNYNCLESSSEVSYKIKGSDESSDVFNKTGYPLDKIGNTIDLATLGSGGTYVVSITNMTCLVGLTTDLTDVAFENSKFTIYPNPTSDKLYLNKTSSYNISDMTGKMLLKGQGSEISILSLNDGIYYITINGRTEKFVKE